MSDPNISSSAREAPDVASASWAAKFFLLSPTFGLLLAMLLIIGGIMAYFTLVKESLPDLEIPLATVSVFWPGADPQTMEQEVTKPIEKEIKTLKGLKSVTSASFDPYSIIAVEFDASARLNDAMQRLRAKIDDARAELPVDADMPKVNQLSVDDRPILSIVLYGNLDASTLSRVAKDLEDRLEQVQGVNEVQSGGLRDEVVQIQLIPERVLALGISPTQVRDAVRAANIDTPWGEIQSEQIGATIRLYGRFRDIQSLERLPIARMGGLGGGRTVRLGEIAHVRRDLEAEKTRAFFSWKGEDFQPGIELSVKKVPGSDTIAVIGAVQVALADAQQGQGWPTAMRYHITQNGQSRYGLHFRAC